MKLKISRREAKESRMFLRLLDLGGDAAIEHDRCGLAQEALELTRIFSAMLRPRN